MQKVLHINADKCTGCLQCEMACSFENYGTFATAKSRIKVFDFHHTGKKVPYTCTQCDEAWCLHACPVEAITVDKVTGAKVVSDSTCVRANPGPVTSSRTGRPLSTRLCCALLALSDSLQLLLQDLPGSAKWPSQLSQAWAGMLPGGHEIALAAAMVQVAIFVALLPTLLRGGVRAPHDVSRVIAAA